VPNVGWVGKNCVFRLVVKSSTQTPLSLCPSTTVVHVQNGAMAEEYAVSSTMVVVKVHKYCSLQCYQHTTLARCAMSDPIAMMLVQNYAGSRIKSDSYWKRCSGWHGGSVCVICTTVRQHFNWCRASCGSLGDSWAFCTSQSTLWIVVVAVHGKDFRKKSNRAVDNVPDLSSADQNKDFDGALYSGSNELVYEL